ncbi:hypothetical protein HYW32_02465 [Candidatus Berkelbacteria bacterium]|nr:hypothetical protein [Candidatus Berkelbacteria bacterium]
MAGEELDQFDENEPADEELEGEDEGAGPLEHAQEAGRLIGRFSKNKAQKVGETAAKTADAAGKAKQVKGLFSTLATAVRTGTIAEGGVIAFLATAWPYILGGLAIIATLIALGILMYAFLGGGGSTPADPVEAAEPMDMDMFKLADCLNAERKDLEETNEPLPPECIKLLEGTTDEPGELKKALDKIDLALKSVEGEYDDSQQAEKDKVRAALEKMKQELQAINPRAPYNEIKPHLVEYEKARQELIKNYGGTNGAKVLKIAREYNIGRFKEATQETCALGKNCYSHARAVYDIAGMKTPPPSTGSGYSSRITTQPKPGYIMDLDLDHAPRKSNDNDGADHTILFDHEEIVNGQRVWRFWHADASNEWVYTDGPPGDKSRRGPYLPDTEGLPVHMWKPVPK